MTHLRTILPAIAVGLLPLHADAEAFSGLSAGGGVSTFSMDMEAEFDHPDFGPQSKSVEEQGPMVDIGYGGMISDSVHLQGGARRYSLELESNLYPHDCLKVEGHRALYGQVGYLFGGRNLVYGVFESGSADVTLATDGHDDRDFDASTFAFGVGYKRALGSYVEFFVEGLSRTYDNLHVDYDEGEFEDRKKDIQVDSTNLSTGFIFRF